MTYVELATAEPWTVARFKIWVRFSPNRISMKPTELIDKRIAELADWRGKTIAVLRKIIHDADPGIKEEWKWDTPVFSHDGLVVAVGVFKGSVKMNFFQGASLPDPRKLFNAGLDAKKDTGD